MDSQSTDGSRLDKGTGSEASEASACQATRVTSGIKRPTGCDKDRTYESVDLELPQSRLIFRFMSPLGSRLIVMEGVDPRQSLDSFSTPAPHAERIRHVRSSHCSYQLPSCRAGLPLIRTQHALHRVRSAEHSIVQCAIQHSICPLCAVSPGRTVSHPLRVLVPSHCPPWNEAHPLSMPACSRTVTGMATIP